MIKLVEILNEYSKNDPIPEITHNNKKVLIVMLGAAGIGKSTFVKEYVLSKNLTFKIIDPDEMNFKITKSHDIYDKRVADMAVKYVISSAQSGQNIIYDITGRSESRIRTVVKELDSLGYTILFIHLLSDLQKSLNQNAQRDRHVPDEKVKEYYDISQQLMRKYSSLPHEAYYVVVSLNNKYKFYKYVNGKLLRRKVDTYV